MGADRQSVHGIELYWIVTFKTKILALTIYLLPSVVSIYIKQTCTKVSSVKDEAAVKFQDQM